MISIRVYLLLTILLALSFHLSAEMEMGTNTTADYLMREVSGTAFGPASAPQHMSMKKSGDWSLMVHGLVDINQIVQSGPRGKDRFFSTNWFMGTASRPLGNGTLMFRSMMSLDPLTVTDRQYPLLFQTGETAFGKPLIDAQHPHDLFMELSMQYAIEISHDTIFRIYFAPVGDPALGPVAFPHRISASEFPQATLSHHLQDSSHIVNEVITGGIHHGIFDFEGSAFHGAEPDERRWNIDHGAIDSWAARCNFSLLQIGALKSPQEN